MPIFFRPGQQNREYKLYRKKTVKDEKGRVSYLPIHLDSMPLAYLLGSISLTSQKEAEYWKQMGHPVTHTLVVQGDTVAQAEDILVRNHEKYYVEGVKNSGGLGIFTGIYCSKREGVAK